jgi:3-oxoacyl-[acyl-carrier-protein] synthase II
MSGLPPRTMTRPYRPPEYPTVPAQRSTLIAPSGDGAAATIAPVQRAVAEGPVPSSDLSRRAVVTGLGAVTPIGNNAPATWSHLLAGTSGVGRITHFDSTGFDVRIDAEVKDFDPTLTMDRKMARRMSRFIHFAMAAAAEAVTDSGLDFSDWSPERRDRVAVVINTGGGGMEQVILGTETLARKGPGQVSPFAIPALSGSMGAAQVSMRYGLTGPVITQVAACASSVISFQDALRLIRSGECDVVVAGGSEAALLPIAFAALGNMGALSKRNDDPTHASRPFDRDRDGFVFGEGAACMVIESAEHAIARSAVNRIQAELLGASLTADAYHISAPEPTGRGAAMAMTKAMRDAGVAPDEMDYVVAHGTSTPLNDVTETRAIKVAYGEHAYRMPISSPKSMVGHLLGAAGAVSAIAAIGAIRDGWIAPTANLEHPDPECDLDYVPLVKRQARVETASINGFGFGGQNAVAVFRAFSG